MIKKIKNYFKKRREQKKQLILLAFEYGLIFSQVAQEQKIEITPDLSNKAELKVVGEFMTQSPTRLSVDMIPNILSVFDMDINKYNIKEVVCWWGGGGSP